MTFTNFSNGDHHSFSVEFLELMPGEWILQSDRFDDTGLPGEMRVWLS